MAWYFLLFIYIWSYMLLEYYLHMFLLYLRGSLYWYSSSAWPDTINMKKSFTWRLLENRREWGERWLTKGSRKFKKASYNHFNTTVRAYPKKKLKINVQIFHKIKKIILTHLKFWKTHIYMKIKLLMKW